MHQHGAWTELRKVLTEGSLLFTEHGQVLVRLLQRESLPDPDDDDPPGTSPATTHDALPRLLPSPSYQ
jgi:hypothetical protein